MKLQRQRDELQQLVDLDVRRPLFQPRRPQRRGRDDHVPVPIAGDLRVVHAESDRDDVRLHVEDARLQEPAALERRVAEHAEVLDLELRVGTELLQPRGKPRRIRLVLIDVHAERPRVADAGDADRGWSFRRERLVPEAGVVQRDPPGRIGAELFGQRRRESAQQRGAIRRAPNRTEDVDVGAAHVRRAVPDQRVVGNENQQPIEPRGNRAVLVAERVRQRHEPHEGISRDVRAPQRDLRDEEKDGGGDEALERAPRERTHRLLRS